MPALSFGRAATVALATAVGLAAGPVILPEAASAAPVPAASHPVHHLAGVPQPMPLPSMAYDYARVLAGLSGRQLETTFMAGMIPHHQMAIEMAELELQRGSHPQLKRLATNIITSQRQEINQMTRWLRRWYRLTPQEALAQAPPRARQLLQMMDQHMQHGMDRLRSVPAGSRFDAAFMQHMIPHHQMAILESLPVQTGATHTALRQLAGDIITHQAGEVVQMLAWLTSWYDLQQR